MGLAKYSRNLCSYKCCCYGNNCLFSTLFMRACLNMVYCKGIAAKWWNYTTDEATNKMSWQLKSITKCMHYTGPKGVRVSPKLWWNIYTWVMIPLAASVAAYHSLCLCRPALAVHRQALSQSSRTGKGHCVYVQIQGTACTHVQLGGRGHSLCQH